MNFKDHFSGLASAYARHRPTYPSELFAYLATLGPARFVALDIATGNGQAAVDLAGHFDLVLASDASARQLAEAIAHPRVHYLRHPAERLPIRSGAVDLIAVAQAAHWFDFERFYAEAHRVLRPGGAVALWTYELFSIEPAIDAAIVHFYRDVVGRYWPPERRYVEEGYRTLPFPLEEIAAPTFEIVMTWSLDDVVSYLGTWSAVDRYRSQRGEDPLPRIRETLAALWQGDAPKSARWPIHLRVGRC